MLDKEKLEAALRELTLGEPKVEVSGSPMFVATVTSGSFAAHSEAARQSIVWKHLREKISPDELTQIEFVFTNVPGEDSSDAEE